MASVCSLRELVGTAISRHFAAAADAGVQIETKLDFTGPCHAPCDGAKLSAALGSLIEHALLGRGDELFLWAAQLESEFLLVVADNGPGTGHDPQSRAVLGCARAIIESQGGKLLVQCVVGRGTSRYLRLPLGLTQWRDDPRIADS